MTFSGGEGEAHADPAQVHLFTDTQCTQGETLAPPNHCEQASTPFKAINVECP